MLVLSDVFRGYIETIILSQLVEKDSYGYEINKKVMEVTNNKFELKEATLYSAFKRLEKNGYISPYWGGNDSGARRRYYSITDNGRSLYNENVNDWHNVKQLISILIEGETNE